MTNKLHKIFSETGCLSDEVLHKYLKNELSKEEKHLVEKHLVDCEICSDVLEGMFLVGDDRSVAAIITDINSDIKSHIVKPKPKSRVIKLNSWIPYVAAAAVILFIISIFYLRKDLSENQLIVAEKVIIPEEKIIDSKDGLAESKEDIVEIEKGNYQLNDKGFIDKDEEIKTVEQEPRYDAKREKVIELNIVNDAMVDEVEISKDVFDETVVTAGATRQGSTITTYTSNATYQPQPSIITNTNAPTEEKATAVSLDRIQEVETVSIKSNKSLLIRDGDSKKDKFSKQKTSSNKERNVQTPNVGDTEIKAKKPEISNEGAVAQNEGTSISTDSVQNTYLWTENQHSTYNLGFTNYTSNNYRVAVGLFNVVLADSINHYNSLYYGGMSYYQINKNDSALIYFNKVLEVETGSFHEDAMWYKALILKRTNEIPETKMLLQSIINENGKYKSQAVKMLKQLN